MVALLIAGTAWAQTPPPAASEPVTIGGAASLNATAAGSAVLENVFDQFNAVRASSVENRYSKGIFSSMVDNYINVREYDPETGTFFFLGGFPTITGLAAQNAAVPNANNPLNASYLNFGLAHTFDFGYMAFYYGGNLATNRGHTNFTAENKSIAASETNKDETVKFTQSVWNNRLAVLFGTADLGAFRLDLIFDNSGTGQENQKAVREGISNREYEGKRTGQGGRIGITWGGMEIAGLNPYATIGFKLPDGYNISHTRPSGTGSLTETWEQKQDTEFGLQVGASHESGLWGDLGIHNASGSETLSETYTGVVPAAVKTNTEYSNNGTFGLALRAGYYKAFDAGPVSFGFNPIIGFGLSSRDYSYTNKTLPATANNDISQDMYKESRTQIKTDLNLGLKYQVSEKFCLYTGAELRLFDFRSVSRSGGNDNRSTTPVTHHTYNGRDEAKAWNFNGILWNTTTVDIGLTFTPIENLIIGAGIETFMNNIFTANVATMRVESGDWFQPGNDRQNILGQALELFRPVRLNLTVSYQIPSGEGAAAAE